MKFSGAEFELLQTLLMRDVRRVDRLTGKAAQSKQVKIVKILAGYFTAPSETGEYELDRNDLRVLETVLYNYRIHLETQSLPEYDRRIQMYPEAAAKYGPYIEKEEAQLAVVCELLSRVEKELKKK